MLRKVRVVLGEKVDNLFQFVRAEVLQRLVNAIHKGWRFVEGIVRFFGKRLEVTNSIRYFLEIPVLAVKKVPRMCFRIERNRMRFNAFPLMPVGIEHR